MPQLRGVLQLNYYYFLIALINSIVKQKTIEPTMPPKKTRKYEITWK